jgi:hypothetical protein
MKTIIGFLSIAAITMALAACPQAIGAVVPALDCGVAIVEDAVSGLTIDQIVTKESARCGADATAIINVLLASTDPRLAGTKAMADERVTAAKTKAAK